MDPLRARLLALDDLGLHRLAIEYDPEPPYDAGAPEKASATAIALVREGVAAREARAAVRS